MVIVTFILILAIFFNSCSPIKERRIEDRYSSVTWSPDGIPVAYFKIHIEYVSVKPRFSLFIGEDTKAEVIEKVQVFLCVNDPEGMSERILDEIELPNDQQDLGVYTNIEWVDEYIRYGVEVQDDFSTGVLQITPEGAEKQLVESGDESIVMLQPRTVNAGDQELYSGFGDYGFFGHRTIFIFDHEVRANKSLLT